MFGLVFLYNFFGLRVVFQHIMSYAALKALFTIAIMFFEMNEGLTVKSGGCSDIVLLPVFDNTVLLGSNLFQQCKCFFLHSFVVFVSSVSK